MAATGGGECLVVVRMADGRVLKGTTHDFAPEKSRLHLIPDGDMRAETVAIPIGAVKAIFFVKSWAGDSSHDAAYTWAEAPGTGRRVRVTFKDGETICGYTTAFAPDKPGFFFTPADPTGNNLRVFAVREAVKKIEWPAAEPAAPRAGVPRA